MSNKDENITPDSQPEGEGAKGVEETPNPVDNPADEKGAVDAPTSKEDATAPESKNEGAEAILSKLNSELGKNYPDLETAIKSIKDTSSFVGKRQETAIEEAKKTLEESGEYINRSTYEKDRFFDKNPNLEPHKDLLEAVAVKNNISFEEASKHESLSGLIEKAGKYDETESAKSVLESDPKLKETSDAFNDARTDLKEGRTDQAQSKAVGAVLGVMRGDK